MRNDRSNIIVTMTFDFALKVIKYAEQLEQLKRFSMANQLFRAGTSIGANIHEAQNAESRADFIHKLKIAAKEADETRYWLELCVASTSYPNPPDELINGIDSIIKVISKIIGTTKKQVSSLSGT